MNKLVAIIVLIALVGGVALLFGLSGSVTEPAPVVHSIYIEGAGAEESGREVLAGYKEYKSFAYSFSLLYPEHLQVAEHVEGGAQTIIFQDTSTGEGFQIFVLPYGEPRISEDRFRKDIPSGVREQVTVATVGGVEAVSFVSRDEALGETREVWFIHDKFLFEVTGLVSSSTWLSAILDSWRFLTNASLEDGLIVYYTFDGQDMDNGVEDAIFVFNGGGAATALFWPKKFCSCIV